jgi:hypothetical protein
LAKIFGVNASLLLSQLIFWNGKGMLKDGWTFKTIDEMEAETGLTRTMQDNAISKLNAYDFFEQKLAGIPAKRHFRIDLDILKKQLPSLKETYKLHYPNPPILSAAKQHSITEITQETTSQNTAVKVNEHNFAAERTKLVASKSARPP